MCDFITAGLAALSTAGAGAATAAGATAGAATAAGSIGSALQTIGLVAGVAGPLIQGIQSNRIAQAQADAIEQQREQESRLNAVEDYRTRKQFRSQIRQQAAQLTARGLSAGSPTAVYLGQTAAEEMAFASQSIRQRGAATDTELSNSAIITRAQGRQSLMKGTFKAAGNFLNGAPEVWPELLA